MPYYDDNGNIMPGYAPSAQPTQQAPAPTAPWNYAPMPQQAPAQSAAQTPVYPVPGDTVDALQRNPHSTTVDGTGRVLQQGKPFNVYPDATLNNQRDSFVNQNSNISANDMYALTRVSQVMNQAVANGSMSLADAQYKFNAISQTLRVPTSAPAVGTPSSSVNPQQNGTQMVASGGGDGRGGDPGAAGAPRTGTAVPIPATQQSTTGAVTLPQQLFVHGSDGSRSGPYVSMQAAQDYVRVLASYGVSASIEAPANAQGLPNNQMQGAAPGAAYVYPDSPAAMWLRQNSGGTSVAPPQSGMGLPMGPVTTTPNQQAMKITPPNTGDAGMASTSYTVQPGDTLSAIAARVGTDYATLASINGIADPNFISVGQRLTLPGGGGQSTIQPVPSSAPPMPQFEQPAHQGPPGTFQVPDVVHGGSARFDEMQVAAIRETFPSSEWNTAFHIAAAESKGDNAARGDAGEIGLFQIHPVNWPGLSRMMGTPINEQSLQNPYINARAARIIWEGSQGWGRVGGNPWATAPGVFAALGG